MIHQPYNDWLLNGNGWQQEALSTSEINDLRQHLDTCTECREWASAYTLIEDTFRSTDFLSPEPGFAARWRTRLEFYEKRMQRRQTLIGLWVSMALALATLLIIVYLNWPLLRSPHILIWTGVYHVLRWFSFLEVIQQTLLGISRMLNFSVPYSIWVLGIGFICQLCVLWIVAVRSLLIPRRVPR